MASFPALADLPLITVGRAADEMTYAAIRWQLDSGRWRRLHPGVFVTHSGPVDWPTRAAGALLAASRPSGRDLHRSRQGHEPALPLPPRVVGLGGWASAYVDGLASPGAAPAIALVVPNTRTIVAPAGSTVTRSRVQRIDATCWPPRTTVESTVMAIADSEPLDGALALLGRGLQQGRTSVPRLAAELHRWARHRHRAVLVDLLDSDATGAESALEFRWVRDVERPHGIPAALRQSVHTVAGRGRRYDLEYPAARLRVELDGLLFHDRATALADRQKSNASTFAGEGQLRYGWVEVVQSPCRTARELALLARSRGANWTVRPCRRADCAIRSAPE